ncbi:MAG: DUF692 family protein [Dehalococcoidia bacterium]|nr:DUF692 family protein [Dehalococcoidia bacterium]
MLPTLGVGLVYNSALEPLLAEHPDCIDVLEIEPQTTWIETGDPTAPYRVRSDVQQHLVALPGRKLVHSVGTPVGGGTQAHAAQLALLRQTVADFDTPWASEHLSFNLTPEFFTGFFLPPRQTAARIAQCVEAIRRLQDAVGVPVAIETGVNYLRLRPTDLPDGEFVAEVADRADCGILLDLHNIYCNQQNGRKTITAFLDQLPLERVWELHLAGGFAMEGYWLDAHSGAVPADLAPVCQQVIAGLPNLKAAVFELFRSFIPHFGLEATHQELQRIRGWWALQQTNPFIVPATRRPPVGRSATLDIAPGPWAAALGSVVIGRPPVSELEKEFYSDPGALLVGTLIKEFRASMVVAVYPMTSRLMMLALGPDIFRALLEDFWSRTLPRQFASAEADAFGDYLTAKNLRLPQLREILAFERVALATLRDGVSRVVRFAIDPLRALADGVLLRDPTPGDYEIAVTGDGPLRIDGLAASQEGAPLIEIR